MSKIKTFFRLLKTPIKLIPPLARYGLLNWMRDETYLKLFYKARLGIELNLDNPTTFNEKLQWLKLYDRQERYIPWVDKVQAKSKVREMLGEEYVVPLIGVWQRAEDIDFESLPDRCVLKCNHDQGSAVVFQRGKSDKNVIIRHFKKCLKRNAYAATREWPYKKIQSKILCEEYVADEIVDYKIFCFNGKAKFVNIGQKSFEDGIMHISFLDFDWNYMPFQRSDFPPVRKLPEKPKCFDKMLEIAEKLAKDTRFVRIDLFCVDEKIYFSEFTLYPTSGVISFTPREGDALLGSWLNLNEA